MKELEWNHWCLWCELCHWAGNWRKRPLTMYFKAYPSYFVFSYNYSTRILFLFQFRAEAVKVIISLYIKYQRFFFFFFFPLLSRKEEYTGFVPSFSRQVLVQQPGEDVSPSLQMCTHRWSSLGAGASEWTPWGWPEHSHPSAVGTGQTGSLEGWLETCSNQASKESCSGA